jgi:hypothetical protein
VGERRGSKHKRYLLNIPPAFLARSPHYSHKQNADLVFTQLDCFFGVPVSRE